MKKARSALALFTLVALTALSAASAQACHRADCDVEDNELFPAEQHYDQAKKTFYAKVNALAKSNDEYDRRRALMLLKEIPGVLSTSESLASKKCDTISRLIGNGKGSNIADFRCQVDEMKKTEAYLTKVLSTFKDLEYPEDQGCPVNQSADQEESHDRSAE